MFVVYDKFINYIKVVGSLICGSEYDKIIVSAAYLPEGSRKLILSGKDKWQYKPLSSRLLQRSRKFPYNSLLIYEQARYF